MKSLFGENNEEWTEDSTNLDVETEKLLRPLIEKYMNKGYKVREICHIMIGQMLSLECLYILTTYPKEEKQPVANSEEI
jgi:hypothetical protein